MKNRKIGWKTYVIMVWVCLIILIPVVAFLMKSEHAGGFLDILWNKGVTLKDVLVQDSVTIEDATIEITDCGICTEWNDMAPEGFDIIYISYDMEGDTSFDIPVYLKLQDGRYIINMDVGQLNLAFGESEEDLKMLYKISDSLEEGYGNLVYLVPEDSKELHMAIYPVINKDGRKAMGEVYLVPVTWEVE